MIPDHLSPHTPPPDPLTRILHGLRDAHPAPGLEDRVQQRLQRHVATLLTPPPSRRRLTPFAWLSFAGLSFACLLLVLTLHRPTPHVAPRVASHFVPTPASTIAQTPTRPIPSPATTQRHTTPPATPSALLAVTETTAASHPPPPLPITGEERLIQSFAARHTATAVAALAPANQPAHDAAERQDFHDFFNPPPPPQPTLTPTPQEPQP